MSGFASMSLVRKANSKFLIASALLLGLTGLTLTASVSSADAAVCARGAFRAGCAGPRGAFVVRRPGPVVVGRSVYRYPAYRYPVYRRPLYRGCFWRAGVRICR